MLQQMEETLLVKTPTISREVEEAFLPPVLQSSYLKMILVVPLKKVNVEDGELSI